jgi:hypothetical protein
MIDVRREVMSAVCARQKADRKRHSGAQPPRVSTWHQFNKVRGHPKAIQLTGNQRCYTCRTAVRICWWTGKGRCCACAKSGTSCDLVRGGLPKQIPHHHQSHGNRLPILAVRPGSSPQRGSPWTG